MYTFLHNSTPMYITRWRSIMYVNTHRHMYVTGFRLSCCICQPMIYYITCIQLYNQQKKLWALYMIQEVNYTSLSSKYKYIIFYHIIYFPTWMRVINWIYILSKSGKKKSGRNRILQNLLPSVGEDALHVCYFFRYLLVCLFLDMLLGGIIAQMVAIVVN